MHSFGENVSGAPSLAGERNLGNRTRAARSYANCQRHREHIEGAANEAGRTKWPVKSLGAR